MRRIPSADRIEQFTGCDRATALRIRRVLDGRENLSDIIDVRPGYRVAYPSGHGASDMIDACDILLGTCGVEAIRDPNQWDRYWGDTVALYCNTGDAYGGTILFDVERQTFYVTTWADWVETAERSGRYKFQ